MSGAITRVATVAPLATTELALLGARAAAVAARRVAIGAGRTAPVAVAANAARTAGRKMAVVSGSGASTAPALMRQLREKGWEVVALTGREQHRAPTPGVATTRIDRAQIHSSEYVEDAVKGALETSAGKIDHLAAINLVGGSYPIHGRTLREMNFEIPVAFYEAVQRVGKTSAKKTSLVNISSVAARINPESCDCSSIKRDLIDWVRDAKDCHHKLSFRKCSPLPEISSAKKQIFYYG